MLSLKSTKVPELKLFCKNAKIKITGKNKLQLFEDYQRHLAVKIIQKWYRKHFYRDAECSITLEKVKYPCFIYRSKCGKLFFYDYLSIVKYISKTGHFSDPMTREEYSDTVLSKLDESIKLHYPDKKVSSTLKIKRNMSYAQKVRDHENQILSYQTILEETKLLILNVIESGTIGMPGSVFINDEMFNNIDEYLLHLLEKINYLFNHLKVLDSFWADCFKKEVLEHQIVVSNQSVFDFFSNL